MTFYRAPAFRTVAATLAVLLVGLRLPGLAVREAANRQLTRCITTSEEACYRDAVLAARRAMNSASEPEASAWLARRLAVSGSPAEAVSILESTVAWPPSDISLATLMARALARDAQVDRVLEVVEPYPATCEVPLPPLLGSLILAKGDAAGAARFYERTLTRCDGRLAGYLALTALADLAERSGDYPTALRWAENAASSQPDALMPWLELGRLRIQAGDPQRGLVAVEHALALDPSPKNTGGYAFRGWARLALGDPESAVKDLEFASRNGAASSGVLTILAESYKQAGRRRDAIRTLERVLAADQRFEPALSLLAEMKPASQR